MSKRNLINGLIATALAIPAAALAEPGNVTIYGVANLSFDWINMGTTAAGIQGTTNRSVSSNASRLGFKGSENLGNGMAANWQIESLVAIDNAGGTLASRNSYVGLSDRKYGALLLGRYDTPYKISTRKLDNFSDSIGDNRSLFGGISGNSASLAFDGRQPNIISYTTPIMAGFSAAMAYVNLNATATTAKAHLLSFSGIYDYNDFYGSLAYESHMLDTVRIGARENAWRIGTGYKTDDFTVGMAYEKTDDTLGGAAVPASCKLLTAGANCLGHSAWYLTGKYSFANDAVKAAYTHAGNLGARPNSDANQLALGYEHHMSKRTMLFAVYTKLYNSAAANYGLGNAAFSTSATPSLGAGAQPSALSFGMKHSF